MEVEKWSPKDDHCALQIGGAIHEAVMIPVYLGNLPSFLQGQQSNAFGVGRCSGFASSHVPGRARWLLEQKLQNIIKSQKKGPASSDDAGGP